MGSEAICCRQFRVVCDSWHLLHLAGVAGSVEVTEPQVNQPTTGWLADAHVRGRVSGPDSLGNSRMVLFRGDIALHRSFCPMHQNLPETDALFVQIDAMIDRKRPTALMNNPQVGEANVDAPALHADAVESG
jgi:hypothetical protein